MENDNLSKERKEFLHLCIIEQEKYDVITKKLSVSRKTLTKWYEELRQERTEIAKIRNLYTRKKIRLSFNDFHKWYISNERKCFYCGIKESEIKELIESNKLDSKRLATRGRTLELDRKLSNLNYDELDNLVFACYWCNNAKTDTFTEEEFKIIGKAIGSVWRKRLKNGTR